MKAAGFEVHTQAEPFDAMDYNEADMLAKIDGFAKFDASKGSVGPFAVQMYSAEDCASVSGVYLPAQNALVSDSTHPKAASVLLELADALRAHTTRLVLDPNDASFGASLRNSMYLNYQIRTGNDAAELCNRSGAVVMEHSVTLIDDEEIVDGMDEEENFATTDAPSDDDEDDDLGFTPPFTYHT